jgi:hypothetical protein
MVPEKTIGYLSRAFRVAGNALPDPESEPLVTMGPMYTEYDAFETNAYLVAECWKGTYGGPKN